MTKLTNFKNVSDRAKYVFSIQSKNLKAQADLYINSK